MLSFRPMRWKQVSAFRWTNARSVKEVSGRQSSRALCTASEGKYFSWRIHFMYLLLLNKFGLKYSLSFSANK